MDRREHIFNVESRNYKSGIQTPISQNYSSRDKSKDQFDRTYLETNCTTDPQVVMHFPNT
jgi:hypothetical protein